MADMFNYLKWRGDILFTQLPPNNADALIFTALAYVRFGGVVPAQMNASVTLAEAAEALSGLPDPDARVRVSNDLALLNAAAATDRYREVRLTHYQDILIPEEDTQFAAVTFLLPDGTAFLSFRGTDSTMVGWKEDFNMTFQDSVPAQRLAKEYTELFAFASGVPIRLGGHSKGGNLAVYAAAKADPLTQDKIIEVFNHDGPGFTEPMASDPGYLAVVPRIRTFVPQSSVFGMLLERREPVTIIRSNQVGLLQHDPYSWEIMGKDFIGMEALTPDSRFLDRTFTTWLAGMSREERNAFFDTLFDLLMVGDTSRPRDIMRPQNLRSYFKALKGDETMRRTVVSELINLADSARNSRQPEIDA